MHYLSQSILLTNQSPSISVIHVLGELAYFTIFLVLTRYLYSVQRGGRVEIIANDQGHRITPSWVGFTDDERLYVPILY